jgi:serine/threonine-protein kinase
VTGGAAASPQIIDERYEVLSVLSSGSMGDVYRARHRELGRTFAVKVVHEGLRGDTSLRDLFFREARLASSLGHPGIVSVTDFGFDAHVGYFLVMELLEGETIRQRQRRGAIPQRIVWDLLDQIASAVRYAHGRGVIHCDLKPENVLVTQVDGESRKRNVAKLLDFGLSWRRDQSECSFGGTPPYVAPERYERQPPTPQSDVYSLGMMLYEMLAGTLPYKGTILEVMEQQLSGPPPPPSDFVQGLDPRADQLVLRALQRNPGARHPSAEAFHFELRTLMNMLGFRVQQVKLAPSQAESVLDSPIPLAIFDPAGTLRFANRSFLELADAEGRPAARCFRDLTICKGDPKVAGALDRVMERRRQIYRELSADDDAAPVTMLMLAPELHDDVITAVHATLMRFKKRS